MSGHHEHEPAVEVFVEIAARPETVWRCVTESDLLSRWLSAKAAIEPRVGGAVTIDFGRHGVITGEVEEFRERESLVFTWGAREGPHREVMPPGSTRVSISLFPLPRGTRVTLRHEGLRGKESRQDHRVGWSEYLGSLAGLAALVPVEEGPEALWDRWFAAWAEVEAEKRAAAIEGFAEEDVVYSDRHVETRGQDELTDWMGTWQGFFPGVRVIRDGPVLNSRGRLLVRWRAEKPDGQRFGAGTSVARLSPDGRLAEVTAFWEP